MNCENHGSTVELDERGNRYCAYCNRPITTTSHDY